MVEIKTYTKSELAALYGISPKTLRGWMKKIRKQLHETGYIKKQSILTPKQVKIIFEHLDPPPEKTIKND